MRRLSIFLGVIALLTIMSCKTTNNDNPTPTEDYTIKYSVASTGNVVIDTIMYMDVDGVEKYELGKTNFEHSFVQPSTNYHAKLYISGTVEDGSCDYSCLVENKDGGIVSIRSSGTSSTSPSSFKWVAEFNHSEN